LLFFFPEIAKGNREGPRWVFPTLDAYRRKKINRSENASIIMMRSSPFGNSMCMEISCSGNFGRRPRGKRRQKKKESLIWT
jgi:hypothetical protein